MTTTDPPIPDWSWAPRPPSTVQGPQKDRAGIVYLLTNRENGKPYVGITIRSLQERLYDHLLAGKTSPRCMIDRAIRKYGHEAFVVRVLSTHETIRELNAAEFEWARQFNAFHPFGYNLKAGNGRGAMSEEGRRRISVANKGKKLTPEQRRLAIEVLRQAKLTPAYREAVRAAAERRRGRRDPPEVVANKQGINAKTHVLYNPGGNRIVIRNLRSFCKKKGLNYFCMVNVRLGYQRSHRGWTRKGYVPRGKKRRPHTLEARMKMAASHRARPMPPEVRQRVTAAARAYADHRWSTVRLILKGPDGTEYHVSNIRRFAREHEVPIQWVRRFLRPDRSQSFRGWALVKRC